MKLKILAFAQARDTFGFSERIVDFEEEETPRKIIARVAPEASIKGLRIAVDCEFSDWDEPVGNADEIALIPPVSGG